MLSTLKQNSSILEESCVKTKQRHPKRFRLLWPWSRRPLSLARATSNGMKRRKAGSVSKTLGSISCADVGFESLQLQPKASIQFTYLLKKQSPLVAFSERCCKQNQIDTDLEQKNFDKPGPSQGNQKSKSALSGMRREIRKKQLEKLTPLAFVEAMLLCTH